MPINHHKPYTIKDRRRIVIDAHKLKDKSKLYLNASKLAAKYGRTEAAICKQIEIVRGWFWAA